MNEQLLFRTTDLEEFEVLEFESTFFDVEKYRRKRLSALALIELLESLKSKDKASVVVHHHNIFDNEMEKIISYTKCSDYEIFVLNLKEQYLHTFFNEKHYKILHPNAFIKLIVKEDMVQKMFIYPYKEFEGIETVLYDNPFPNIFTNNETCMGSADKSLKNTKMLTAISIIETAYTHAYTNFNDKDLKETKFAFEYLEKNKFPYDKLMSSNLKLKDLIEMCKLGK